VPAPVYFAGALATGALILVVSLVNVARLAEGGVAVAKMVGARRVAPATRDELQGVIAHEFSHILNGDMRLNIRMIGVLAGIVFLASVGEFLMRSMRGSRDSKGLVLVGLALFIIGYVGLFFARLIKA